MERLADKLQKIINEQDFCFTHEEMKIVNKALKRLDTYEDAEEQGLLLRLPCKVGDTVWVIDENNEYPGTKKVYEATWNIINLVQTSSKHSFKLCGEVKYQVYDYFYNDGRTTMTWMYVGQKHTKIGEVVFFTKEEAEKALAKMKGGARNV